MGERRGKSKFKKNVTWVFIGNAFHAVLQFLLNVLAARVLSKHDYGLINYSISLVALFNSVSTLGFSGVISKKFAESEDLGGAFLLSAFLSRIVISIPFTITIMIIGFAHSPDDSNFHCILLCQSLSLIFSAGDIFVYWFRYKYKASTVAITRLIAFGIMSIWRLIALYLFESTILYTFCTVFETALLSCFLIFIYIKQKQPKLRFDFNLLKSMLGVSYPFIFSAILATVYGQTDKLMLESMVSTEAVAYYSVSLTLASAISILPSALIEGFRPEIFVQKENSEENYRRRLAQLYGIVFWVCVMYCLFITVFAKNIILLLYGEKYLPAVGSLSLIVWYTSFSYFGAINNIYMIAEKKTKWVQITTLIGALLNISLNTLLIPHLGIYGAALASLITQIVTNFFVLYLIKPLRDNFFIAIKGISFFYWIRKQ
ncbi:MAG: flippase [Eubacteriales bacterium]|nr:flippase [Eubacteriales bacterium]